jgi:hypothetical protein
MEEIFKIIPSFPDYLVSNFGRVKTISRKLRYIHAVTKTEHFRQSSERFLKVQYNKLTGYKYHQLYLNKKMYNKPIHQLVADAFLDRVVGFDWINHKDGNKHNNCVENLEWCTMEYNHHHATITGLVARGDRVGTSKLNDNTVHAIKWFLNKGFSHQELSEAFKVSRPNISMIANNKTWKHIKLTVK